MRKLLLETIESFASRRVLVIGDLMVDEFVRGDVARISPEAPVPVLEVTSRSFTLGGAANTAANVRSLGGAVTLVGVTGDDPAAGMIRERAAAAAFDIGGIVADATRPTTHKTRMVARGQQIVRIDHESRAPVEGEAKRRLFEEAADRMQGVDACIVSDYAKGVISPELVARLAEVARSRKIPVVADPKRRDLSAYRGTTVITPNLLELEAAVGGPFLHTDEIVAAARTLLPQLDGGAIVVTRGAAGMTLIEQGREPIHVGARARAVFDVTGAGDTVVSTLALALAAGSNLEVAIDLASHAAGIAVSKEGTATVTSEELKRAVTGEP